MIYSRSARVVHVDAARTAGYGGDQGLDVET